MGLPSAKKDADLHLSLFMITSRCEADEAIGRKTSDTALTLAGANEEVAVGGDSTKSQVYHRPSVTGAGERSLSHCHGLELVRT